MNQATRDRLWGTRHAFDSALVLWLTVAVLVLLAVTPIIVEWLHRREKISDKHRVELLKRYYSWLILAPLMIVPVLLGAGYTIIAVGILSLLCFREYSRATGLFRERLASFRVALFIILTTFAVLDHWYGLFVALAPLGVGTIAAGAILADRPKGYVQRVSLGVFGYMLFGCCLGHLGYFANDPNYRPILFWLVMCTELNDVFAYITGKSFGHRKLAPNTSPNKTLGGALGALVLTTILAAVVGRYVFAGTEVGAWPHVIAMGIIISLLGQLGDLLLSSIKRDIGIKDMGAAFPGHGGLLDRFDSLILVAPAIFHYVGAHIGVGLTEQAKLFHLW